MYIYLLRIITFYSILSTHNRPHSQGRARRVSRHYWSLDAQGIYQYDWFLCNTFIFFRSWVWDNYKKKKNVWLLIMSMTRRMHCWYHCKFWSIFFSPIGEAKHSLSYMFIKVVRHVTMLLHVFFWLNRMVIIIFLTQHNVTSMNYGKPSFHNFFF